MALLVPGVSSVCQCRVPFGINYMASPIDVFIPLAGLYFCDDRRGQAARPGKLKFELEEAPAELEFVSALDAEAACLPVNGP